MALCHCITIGYEEYEILSQVGVIVFCFLENIGSITVLINNYRVVDPLYNHINIGQVIHVK